MTIYLNDVEVTQPIKLNEQIPPEYHEHQLQSGDRDREEKGRRVVIEIQWGNLTPEQYRQVWSNLQGAVRYFNDSSHHGDAEHPEILVDCVADVDEGEYLPGESFARPIAAVLYENSHLHSLATEDGDILIAEDGTELVTE